MLQFEELKLALDELKPDLFDLEEALDLKAAGEEMCIRDRCNINA